MRGVIALLAILAGISAQPVHAAQPEGQPAGQPYRIGFGDRLATQVMIDGQGPFTFIIDTASSRSLIFEHTRAQLKLTRSQPGDITIYSLNESSKALPVEPSVLTVAGKEIKGLTLGVLPADVSGIDGILGIDVLSRYFVVLDRNTMRLMLLAPDSKAAQQYRDWTSVALTPRPLRNIPIDFWYMTASIDQPRPPSSFGPIRFTALFDLGAGFTSMNWPAAERLGAHEKDYHLPQKVQTVLRDVLGTDEPAIRIQQATIMLSSRSWSGQTVLVANSDVFVHFDLAGKPAMVLGAGLLRDNSLAIDFAGHRLFIGPMVHQSSEG